MAGVTSKTHRIKSNRVLVFNVVASLPYCCGMDDDLVLYIVGITSL